MVKFPVGVFVCAQMGTSILLSCINVIETKQYIVFMFVGLNFQCFAVF